MALLSLTLLGPVSITGAGRSLSGIESQKGKALLVYLAATSASGQIHERESLAFLLWPNESSDTSRKNLRQVLYNLRQVLPPAGNGQAHLHVTRQTVQLPASEHLWVDIHEFSRTMAQVRRHNHPSPHTCPDCAPRLQAAVAL